jgi:glycosyltransferase involved in cell wall biosynthesis
MALAFGGRNPRSCYFPAELEEEVSLISRPLVSVLINNYNYARYLGEAIDSALAQTYHPAEVIVVDDGSTDGSRDIIASYGSRIVSIAKQNGGQASAFNAGFAASKGDIICFLDSDDLFLPEKLSSVVKIFEDQPQIGWCFDTVRQFENSTGERYPRPQSSIFGPLDVRERTAAGRPPNIPIATSGVSFRRDILLGILPMPERIRITSDNYIKFVAMALAKGWMASEDLSLQRIHSHNAYTHRRIDKRDLVARTGLLTGLSLHEQFPKLRRLATSSFSYGLGMCWRVGRFDSECRQLTRSFFSRLTPWTRAEVLMRSAYWSLLHLRSHS